MSSMRSFVRGGLRDTLAKMLSGLILAIGFIMAFFTENHRALHDMLVGSRVVQAN